MKHTSILLLLGVVSASAFAQTGTTTPSQAGSAASTAPTTTGAANPNRLDPANTHLRRDCFDPSSNTFKATRECDAVRLGAPVADSATAPGVGTSSALSSSTTTGTNAATPSPGLAPPAGSTPPPAPVIGSSPGTVGR